MGTIIVIGLVSLAFSIFLAYSIGNVRNRGKSLKHPNELPDALFTVIWLDGQDMVIETMDKNFERFLVKREVIRGPVFVGDALRKPHSFWEFKKRNLQTLDYPQLVKCVNQW